MYTVMSSTITDEDKAINVPLAEWKFQIPNENTGVLVISDPLLDSLARATQRADSDFLKNSYELKEIRFTTYRTDLTKNMIINVRGLPYIIKGISTTITDTSIKTAIRAVRYV